MSEENKAPSTNERPTHTFETTNGHKVVLKDWITGREEDEIQRVFLDAVEMRQHMGGGQRGTENLQQEVTGMRGSLQLEAERKAIETVVVSVDGHDQNVVDHILDMRSKDRNEVKAEIDRITDSDEEGEKKA